MKKVLLSLLFSVLSLYTFGQTTGLRRADKNYDGYAYIDAIKTYERIAAKGYKNADLFKKLGNAYYFNSQFDKAASWYDQLFAMTNDVETEVYYRYSQCLKAVGNYAKADDMMNAFVAKTNEDLRGKNFSEHKDYMKQIEANSGRYNIGDAGVNSKYSDYGSTVYEGQLVFSSARDTGNFVQRKHKWSNQYFTNMYAAAITGDSVGKSMKFAKNVNTRFHEATPVFSKDGKTMYFTRNDFNDGKKGMSGSRITLLKIYKATKVVEKKEKDSTVSWTNVIELPFNSSAYSVAHPALSADGKWLYFASDMPGGKGQSDIWKVEITGDNSYGTPVNLGDSVNTEGKETFPFVTNENELYFASDGYQGLGGMDLYMSRINQDGTYEEPQNLGAPANSKMDDFAYYIDTKTRKGFLTSNREGGAGSDDIYKFLETRKLICEQELSGIVTDLATGEVLPNTKVTLFDEKFNKLKEVMSDDKGFYDFGTVDCGKAYYVRAEKEEYETKEQKVTISKDSGKTDLPIQLEKRIKQVKVGDDLADVFGINYIYFDLDKWDIRPDAAVDIAKVLDVLMQYPTMSIDIRSHTDSRASHKYNQKLSERRAKSTRDWLISKGIAPERLTSKGYGETQLVNKCADGVQCTEEEHQKNRRSQFIITAL
ncbi:OmpA family protein [Flavobacterium sp. MAH-1]|uniref:OmpA family protein n=1 Tax=Flavobacterium agri TaxID=2743471 RepID=A0A7Y8XZM8_9FLAO|nr:OmpA family protein [Flavobacterium agri]NUY79705.1 OmpA family protein [Flavobacterium agri]NYA69730.1 OmpA family protein [Flavobacterium agri]